MRVAGRGRRFEGVLLFLSMMVVLGSVVVSESPGAWAADPGLGGGSTAVGGFSDDDGGVHEPAIDALDDAGVLEGTGCGEGRFCPDDPMPRWVMAVWMIRVLGETAGGDVPGSRFADVEADEWWVPYVERLADLGITVGCDTDPLRYCPRDPVKRAQMASFLVRAFRLSPAVSVGFSDTGGDAHEANIDSLAAARVTVGCGNSDTDPLRYCPYRAVTRGQMASFLARAAGLVPLPKVSEGPATVQVLLEDVTDGEVGRFEVRVVFDELVSGFERDDVVVVNGRVTAFGGSGHLYRVSVERWAGGTVVVAVPAGVADDYQGDPNESSAPLVWGKNPGPWIDTWDREAVLESYRQEFDRPQPSPEFTGSVRDCEPGTTSQAFRDSVVRRVNWYRAMGGLDPVTESHDASEIAQAAALIMAARGRPSHYPPPDWRCWTPDGLRGASSSNLYVGVYGTSAVDGYMQDPGGDNIDVSHRHWILFPKLTGIGTGDIPGSWGANALFVADRLVQGDYLPVREPRGFVAWPPPGYVPAQAVWGRWSFSLENSDFATDHVDFSDATVTMFDHNGQVRTRILSKSYQRLVWAVDGDTNSGRHPRPESGDRCYTVTIRGIWKDDALQEPYQYVTCVLAEASNTSRWPQSVELTLRSSGSEQTDRDALVALYNSTDGPSWPSATNWNTEKPLDQWEGVTTDRSGRVISLTLQYKLAGPIPQEIGDLSRLTRLDLSHNRLTGSIPREIGNLASLRYLTLQFNELTGSIPREIGNLAALRYLTLQFNELTGSIPREIGNLAALQFLTLQFNELTGSIPKEIGKLTQLLFLNLRSNQFTGPIPREIGRLTRLLELFLSNNQLSGPIPKEVGDMSNLHFLYLSDNQLSGPIPPEVGNLNRIRTVALAGNQLTGCIPTSLLQSVIDDVDLPACED